MTLLKDVARACGVSKSTASIALRGVGFVSAETRARVLAAAERLGYRPDPEAARLSGRKKRPASLAKGLPVVIVSSAPPVPSNRGGQRLHDYALQLGYASRFTRMPENPDRWRGQLRRWYNQGVAGVAFHRLAQPVPEGLEEWRRFSLVNFFGNPVEVPCHSVRLDVGDSVSVCWQRLHAKGYRRIGLAVGRHEPEIADDRERIAVALLMQTRAAGEHAEVPLFTEHVGGPDVRRLFVQWFERHRPDAVVGFSVGMKYWLQEAGHRVPEDVAFATLHHVPSEPAVSGYAVLAEECAEKAIDLLDQLIRRNETGWPERPLRMMLSSRWAEGETSPACG